MRWYHHPPPACYIVEFESTHLDGSHFLFLLIPQQEVQRNLQSALSNWYTCNTCVIHMRYPEDTEVILGRYIYDTKVLTTKTGQAVWAPCAQSSLDSSHKRSPKGFTHFCVISGWYSANTHVILSSYSGGYLVKWTRLVRCVSPRPSLPRPHASLLILSSVICTRLHFRAFDSISWHPWGFLNYSGGRREVTGRLDWFPDGAQFCCTTLLVDT